jgi:hypothetical protein
VGTYGLATGEWVLVASEGAFALGSLTIVSRLLSGRRTAGWVAGCALLMGSAYAVLGPGPCLVAATAASVTARVAQIRAAIRSGTAAGVSVLTWLLLASANFAWAATGVLRSDVFFAWSAAAGGVSSLAVIGTCTAVSRRTARAARSPQV